MSQDGAFTYEITESEDATNGKKTTVICHGRLVNQSTGSLSDVVKPLIQAGGAIVIDLSDVAFLDSWALGTLVSLKVSAINKGYCTLELHNLSPRVKQLLSMTNLSQLFSHGS